ncbi:hypothetical protein ACFQ73_09710 [Amycolatopsis japonica]
MPHLHGSRIPGDGVRGNYVMLLLQQEQSVLPTITPAIRLAY